jgi:LemA protein
MTAPLTLALELSTGTLLALGAAGVGVLGFLWLIAIYNGLVRLRVAHQGAWSNIDVSLKRRHDLIPNLVETVKGYAAHEKQTLENVINARQACLSARGIKEQGRAEAELSGAVRQIFALQESYPDLKANTNFLQLQGELTSTENQIGGARQGYNHAVREYNTRRQVFPHVLIAGVAGFQEAPFFEIEDSRQRETPKVSFA